MSGVLYPRSRGAASRGDPDERELNGSFSVGSVQDLQSAGRDKRVNTMTIEIFVFFAIAASLVAAGFVSGPVIARRVNSTHSHFNNPHSYR